MKYLLQVTRNTRAERPSEQVIAADSTFADTNEWGSVTQDLVKDNFFILSADDSPIEIVLIKLLALDQLYSPAKILDLEGYAVIEYPYSNRWTAASSLRPGSTAVVQWASESTSGQEGFGTLAEAYTFIGGLNSSDYYVLIDQAGVSGTKNEVIYSRPSLWYNAPEPDLNVYPLIKQQNFLGRTDTDRA
jgi:hypothetical protein